MRRTTAPMYVGSNTVLRLAVLWMRVPAAVFTEAYARIVSFAGISRLTSAPIPTTLDMRRESHARDVARDWMDLALGL